MVLVGDAAGFTSPLFEGGPTSHCGPGARQRKRLPAAIKENDLSSQRLMAYERAGRNDFPYHKILKGKTALYELTDEEMSTMARCLPDELGNMSPLDKAVIGLKILVRRPFC